MLHVRNFFERANKEIFDTQRVCDFLVQNLVTLFVLYLRENNEKNPFLVPGNQPKQTFVAAFTDRNAADRVRLRQSYDVELVEEPILSFLIQTYRSEASGLILNPGLPSRFFILKEYLHKLIVEYAVDQLSRMPGAWIPTKKQHMLLVEHEKDQYTIAIYASKEDAELMCKEAGGTSVLHSWKAVFERAQEVGAQSLYLHFHLPEQEYLSPSYIDKIWKGRHQGYQERTSVTHPYQIRLIGDETPKQASQVADDQTSIDQPKSEKEKGEKVQTTSAENREERTGSEEKREKKQKKYYPSERVNPYSIKNKKKELEIYRGGKGDVEEFEGIQANEQEKVHKKSHVLTEPMKVSKRQQVKQTKKEAQARRKGNQGLPQDVREGLERLEKATIEGQGMANGWEVCQVLAGIRRIWIIVDQQENMVILAGQDQSPIVDFFTSDVYAQRLIDEAHKNNPSLPPMYPQLVSTKKLYRALAPRQPIVWINRGSSGAWTSVMGDTLPYVLQLMAQLRKEKI